MSRILHAIETATNKAVQDAIDSPAVPLRSEVPNAAARIVAGEVARDLAPVVAHLANQEPWYQSRVTWGAIIGIVVPLLGLLGVATDTIDRDEATAVGVAFGTAVGGALTLYGRWKATKPILGLLLLIAIAPGLAGCNMSRAAVPAPSAAVVTRADVVVAKTSAEVVRYCGLVRGALVAAELFAAREITLRAIDYAQAVVDDVCESPPSDVVTALGSLQRAYQNVVAASRA